MSRTRGCTGLVAAPDSWLHRTRGCTGLVAAPDPRPCALVHTVTCPPPRTRLPPVVGPVARGPWPPTFTPPHLHTAPPSRRHRDVQVHGTCPRPFTSGMVQEASARHPPTFFIDAPIGARESCPFHFQFNRRRRQFSTILCISRLLSLVRSGFHPCFVCRPSPSNQFNQTR